jgi:hypothetical protein
VETDRAHFLVDICQSDSGQFGFHSGMGLDERGLQDGLDLGANRAVVVGREIPQAKVGGGFDCPIDVEQRYLLRLPNERKAAASNRRMTTGFVTTLSAISVEGTAAPWR